MAIVRRRGSGCVVQPLRSHANASRMITEMRRRDVLKVKALSLNSGTKSDPHKPGNTWMSVWCCRLCQPTAAPMLEAE